MKNIIKFLLITAILFSSVNLRAHENLNDVFMTQKMEIFGIAGSPWEKNVSYEEERSRAFLDALNHAYEQIIKLPLMDSKEIKDILLGNRAFKERLGQLLFTSPRKFYQTDSSGINRCCIEISLSGKNSLRSTFYLAALRPQPMQPTGFLASWTAGIPVDENAEPSKYKRIIIDARNYYFEPSLFPRFFDKSGMLIFQEAMIPEAARFSRPAIKFVTSMEEARNTLNSEYIFTAASMIDELHPRDVVILPEDIKEFSVFCNDIVKTPLKEREIFIVFDPETKLKYGNLEKTESEESK